MNNKKAIILATIALVVGLLSGYMLASDFSRSETQAQPLPGGTEAMLWELEQDYVAKRFVNDGVGNTHYWHDQFYGWPSKTATPIGKQQGLAWLRKFLSSGKPISSEFEIEKMGLRIYNGMAVVHYRLNTSSPVVSSSRVVHFWISTEDGWKILGGASSIEPGI